MSLSTTLRALVPFLSLTFLATACATPRHAARPEALALEPTPGASARAARASATESRAAADAGEAWAVLAAGQRVFVLTGSAAAPPPGDSSELLPGGFVLDHQRERELSGLRFTLVGPEGRCLAVSVAAARLGVRAHGAAAALGHAAVEVTGCAELARANGFMLALSGDDPSAGWLEPVGADEQVAPADRRLGESEVFLQRWAFAGADAEVVERRVMQFVGRACSAERRDVIVVDETERPLANHRGFALRGALRTSRGVLLVLLGHEDPEALRVVTLDAPDERRALDRRVALFPDVERAECGVSS
jgi:hypothetical protein